MKIARLAGLMLVAVLAMSLVAVSAASAAGPLFLTSGKPTLTSTSGVSKLLTPGASIEIICQKDSSGGEVTSTTLAGKILVHFLECEGKTATATCPVMSPGAPLENLIITKTLHGVLGLVLPKPASGSDVGLLVLPGTGSEFVKLLGSCLPGETSVEGSVAGLVEPVGSLVLAGTIKFQTTNKKQVIKEIDLTNGPKVEPELVAFSATSAEETNETVAFSKDVEVM